VRGGSFILSAPARCIVIAGATLCRGHDLLMNIRMLCCCALAATALFAGCGGNPGSSPMTPPLPSQPGAQDLAAGAAGTLRHTSSTAQTSGTFSVLGTIASTGTDTFRVDNSPCGNENVDYTSSTTQILNGQSIALNTKALAIGSGSCSTNVQATEFVLAPASYITLSGTIGSTGTNTFNIHGSQCGSENIYYGPSTSVSGTLSTGVNVNITGYGSCTTAVLASTIADPSSSPSPSPSPSVPPHVKIYAYWNSTTDSGVTASWMASHVNFMDGDAGYAQEFKGAGGQYAVDYTDPFKIVVANHEPMWNMPEGSWFHNSSGARVYTLFDGSLVQNLANPTAATTLSAWVALTESIEASGPFDYLFVDNTNWDLLNVWYGSSNGPGVEVTSDAVYEAGTTSLFAASSVPVIFNGLGNSDEGTVNSISNNTMYLPVSAGGFDEGCLYDSPGPRHDEYWTFDENTIIATLNTNKYHVCMARNPSGTDSRAPRIYALASWWMTYNSTYSVIFPEFTNTGNVYVFPEYSIVPTDPLQTATSNVSTLKSSNGTYYRQFGACYQSGKSLGTCAAIVNPQSSGTLSLPSIASQYKHALVLDTNNSFSGGTATLTTSIPSSLSPEQAVVLFQ